LEDLPPVTTPKRAFFKTFTPSGFATSIEWQSRIAVTHTDFGPAGLNGDTIVVSFIATPNMGDATGLGLFSANSGAWSVRADLFVAGTSLLSHVYRPVPVMQVGQPIGKTGSTVTGLAVYDQLANEVVNDAGKVRAAADGDHRVALWVSTSTGGQMIIRAAYIQQFGVSGGNSKTVTNTCCTSGTLGALVKKSGINYILSNDHVFGIPQSPTVNAATVGDPVSDPGLIDYACLKPHPVAKFASAPTLNSGIDAGLATLTPGQMNSTGRIYNIGVPSSTILAPTVGMLVAKQGRTTGLTCGKVAAVNMSVTVNYTASCGSTTSFPVTFPNQVMISSTTAPFSIAGDSGSLIVSQSSAQPIGLLFAGQSTTIPYTTFATPSSTVASTLGITFAGGANHTVTACHGTSLEALPHAETDRVSEVKARHEADLFKNPAVLAVGVGAADNNPSEGVIVVLVDRSKDYAIPPILDGVRTKVFASGPIYAQPQCQNSSQPNVESPHLY
jgi:hypothetical protein